MSKSRRSTAIKWSEIPHERFRFKHRTFLATAEGLREFTYGTVLRIRGNGRTVDFTLVAIDRGPDEFATRMIYRSYEEGIWVKIEGPWL